MAIVELEYDFYRVEDEFYSVGMFVLNHKILSNRKKIQAPFTSVMNAKKLFIKNDLCFI